MEHLLNMFSRDFCDSLPEDRLAAIDLLVAKFFQEHTATGEWGMGDRVNEYVAAMQAVKTLARKSGLSFVLSDAPQFSDSPDGNGMAVVKWFQRVRKAVRTATYIQVAALSADEYDQIFSDPLVELTADEYDRIQKLVSDIKDCVTSSEAIDHKTRDRLLARLDRILGALQKTIFNVDAY